MSEFLGIVALFVVTYVGMGIQTSYIYGRYIDKPPERFHDNAVIAAVAWPIALPLMLMYAGYRRGQIEAADDYVRRGTPTTDGWHEWEDERMIVRWRDRR